MSKIYVGQDALRITLETEIDIASAAAKIKYRKPDKTEGEWVAVIGAPSVGTIYYDVADDTILDQQGEWIIWAEITFVNTTVALGEPAKMYVNLEGY